MKNLRLIAIILILSIFLFPNIIEAKSKDSCVNIYIFCKDDYQECNKLEKTLKSTKSISKKINIYTYDMIEHDKLLRDTSELLGDFVTENIYYVIGDSTYTYYDKTIKEEIIDKILTESAIDHDERFDCMNYISTKTEKIYEKPSKRAIYKTIFIVISLLVVAYTIYIMIRITISNKKLEKELDNY